jgi:alpha-ketoglutarate-dependent taurine dioxygenase
VTALDVTHSFLNEQRLPLVYEPARDSARGQAALLDWLAANSGQLANDILSHGAVLLRGFDVSDASAFERIALAIDPQLSSEYPGVALRRHVTQFVHTASELPSYYPIPQHAELAYTSSPPRKVFFFCETAPRKGGETPLSDLRKVWSELSEGLRAKLEQHQIRYRRVHGGPDEGPFRLWGGRRWSDVFETRDREVVEQAAREQGLTLSWLPDGALSLENTLPACRTHPVSGITAWHNHANIFHPDGPMLEYSRLARLQGTVRSLAVNLVLAALSWCRRSLVPPQRYDWSVSYGDGSHISRSELTEIYDAIWRHIAHFRWQRGDLLVVDNYAVSHGRLPYSGERSVLVAMTDGYRK